MKIIEQKEWCTHQLIKWSIDNQTDHPQIFLTIMPSGKKKIYPWILALHGYTSNKEEWLELDGYTKGGNTVKALVDHGYAVVAVDMAAHGDNIHTEKPIDYDSLMNAGWEEFFDRTVENLETVMSVILKSGRFDEERYGYLSYSLGGLFGFWLANRNIPFKTLVMCVPPVWKEDPDQYVPYNNLNNLGQQSILFVVAEQDENIPFADSEWLYAQLPMTDKKFVSYLSGHSLPIDYVTAAVEWINLRV